jgi:tRNA pseudouridine13 synthase
MEPHATSEPASELPYATADLPGCGGELKSSPEHFVVDERALYEPSGSGEHVYLRVRRAGWTTRDLARDIARCAGLAERDVGYAGLKDKHAIVTQTFSVAVKTPPAELAARVAGELGVEVLGAARHGNKLKRGHLAGNRFTIVIARPEAGALERARKVAERLLGGGIANFYGEQRVGAHGENARRGERDLAAPRNTFASRFALNAYQAELFNRWLCARIELGLLARVLAGDVAKKVANGALFDVVDESAEAPRAERGEIVPTGPIFGARMRAASGVPGELEARVLAESGATNEHFARARLDGTRRAARVFLRELAVEPCAEGLRCIFELPKGAYATVVMRELTKRGSALGELDEE